MGGKSGFSQLAAVAYLFLVKSLFTSVEETIFVYVKRTVVLLKRSNEMIHGY